MHTVLMYDCSVFYVVSICFLQHVFFHIHSNCKSRPAFMRPLFSKRKVFIHDESKPPWFDTGIHIQIVLTCKTLFTVKDQIRVKAE